MRLLIKPYPMVLFFNLSTTKKGYPSLWIAFLVFCCFDKVYCMDTIINSLLLLA